MDGLLEPVFGADEELVKERLELWKRVSAGGDAARFARRLSWDGLSLEDAQRLLGPMRLKDGALPPWTKTMESVLSRCGQRKPEPAERPGFDALLAPFVDEAWHRLCSRAAGLRLLSPTAAESLRRDLGQELTLAAAPALLNELAVRKAMSESSLDALLRKAQGQSSTVHHDALMADLLGDGRHEFFLQYAVLARLLCLHIERWAEHLAEFLDRLEADRCALGQAFGLEAGAKIVTLRTDASDAHEGGRRVVIATFADGKTVVYKPRGAGQWQAWDGLLGWLNAEQSEEPFFRMKLLARDPDVWLEFVRSAPCSAPDQVRGYFRRVGRLMALLHVLRGVDIHLENIVAFGELPVLVDVEMLFQGRKLHRGLGSILKGIHDKVCEKFCGSVVATGLLPFWSGDGMDEDHDASGLGGIRQFRHTLRVKDAGSDDAALEWEKSDRAGENAVVLDGKKQEVLDNLDDLLAGFQSMGRWLAEHKAELLCPQGPCSRLADEPVRYLLRNTAAYAVALGRSLDLSCLREGIDRSLRLESMAGLWTGEERGKEIWPLYKEENLAMERLDIPLFTGSPRLQDRAHRQGRPIAFYESSGWERFQAGLASLDQGELDFQSGIARMSLLSRADSRLDLAGLAGLPPPTGPGCGRRGLRAQSPVPRRPAGAGHRFAPPARQRGDLVDRAHLRREDAAHEAGSARPGALQWGSRPGFVPGCL